MGGFESSEAPVTDEYVPLGFRSFHFLFWVFACFFSTSLMQVGTVSGIVTQIRGQIEGSSPPYPPYGS